MPPNEHDIYSRQISSYNNKKDRGNNEQRHQLSITNTLPIRESNVSQRSINRLFSGKHLEKYVRSMANSNALSPLRMIEASKRRKPPSPEAVMKPLQDRKALHAQRNKLKLQVTFDMKNLKP